MPGSKKSPNQKDRQLTRPFGSGSNQPVSKAPPPITPLAGISYVPTTPVPRIPELVAPGETPGKQVRRKLRRYLSFDDFLRIVKIYTEKEPETILDSRNAPDFQKLEILEVLRDVYNRLPKEFQGLKEIHWLLASHWKDELSERHIYRVARGIRKFIVKHCKDMEEGNNRATLHQEVETEEAVAQRVADREDQGAEKTATVASKKKYDKYVEERREVTFEFLRRPDLRVGSPEDVSGVLRKKVQLHILYGLFSEAKIVMISSSEHDDITWFKLKTNKDLQELHDKKIARYLAKDTRRHWDRLWDKSHQVPQVP